ncbi:MAG: hypothetical protein WAV38_35155, partial [Xanthobacteraceae bacterium]
CHVLLPRRLASAAALVRLGHCCLIGKPCKHCKTPANDRTPYPYVWLMFGYGWSPISRVIVTL